MRTPRKPEAMTIDPERYWRVAFLLGRIDTIAWTLKESDDPEKKKLGERLAETTDWFFETKET